MGFIQSIESCFKHYFTFTGRAPRSEYNYWILFNGLLGFTSTFVAIMVTGDEDSGEVLNSLVSLAIAPAGISVVIRRLHDIGKSGWSWLWFITIVGIPVVIYWLCFKKGEESDNLYGSDPLLINSNFNQNDRTTEQDLTFTTNNSNKSVEMNKPKASNDSGTYKKGGLVLWLNIHL